MIFYEDRICRQKGFVWICLHVGSQDSSDFSLFLALPRQMPAPACRASLSSTASEAAQALASLLS